MKPEEFLQKIFEQREEILEAFVAKYRAGPEQVQQIVEADSNGKKFTWYVEHTNRAELETAFLKAVRFVPLRLLSDEMKKFAMEHRYSAPFSEKGKREYIQKWMKALEGFADA